MQVEDINIMEHVPKEHGCIGNLWCVSWATITYKRLLIAGKSQIIKSALAGPKKSFGASKNSGLLAQMI